MPNDPRLLERLINRSTLFLALSAVLMYVLGTGVARYQGITINWQSFSLGMAWILLNLFGVISLFRFYELQTPGPNVTPPKTLSETEMLRRSQNIYRMIFAVLLAFSAVLFMILYRESLLHGGLILVLGIGLLLSFAIVVPPVRLYTSGIGELVLSFLICNIIPAIAFLFQSSELHRLISMSTLPLTAIFMAVLIGAQFPSFAKDCTYCQSTILVRLGWQNGVGLHNMLILAVYVITGAAYFLGMPWRLVWPMLLTVPFAVYLIFQMNRISAGAKPGWLMFQMTGGALFLLAAYLLTFTYWTI